MRGWTLTGEVRNLLGARYSTFGALGEPDEVLGDGYDNPLFLGPGSPRSIMIALSWRGE